MIKLDDLMLLADEQGYNAAVAGSQYGDNPHLEGDDDLRAAWNEGWERATEAMINVERYEP